MSVDKVDLCQKNLEWSPRAPLTEVCAKELQNSKWLLVLIPALFSVQINVSNMDHTLGIIWGLLWTLVLLRWPLQGAHGFFPNFWSRAMAFAWGSVTHQDMTEEAILRVTMQLFIEMPHPKGKRIREEDFKVR